MSSPPRPELSNDPLLPHVQPGPDADSVFLPINTTTGKASPPYVLIDRAVLPAVLWHNWTTSPTAQVVCRQYDPVASAAERKIVQQRLVLTDFVLQHQLELAFGLSNGPALVAEHDAQSSVVEVGGTAVYRNGDSLDCRAANLLWRRDASIWPRYAPGSSFVSAPAFAEARARYPAAVAAYREHFRRGRRPTVLSHEEVREFLNDILDESLDYGTMSTRELVRSYFHDGLGKTRVNAQLVSDILAGRAMPQPGIDYTHPRIRYRTREAVRARRKKLHADAEKTG